MNSPSSPECASRALRAFELNEEANNIGKWPHMHKNASPAEKQEWKRLYGVKKDSAGEDFQRGYAAAKKFRDEKAILEKEAAGRRQPEQLVLGEPEVDTTEDKEESLTPEACITCIGKTCFYLLETEPTLTSTVNKLSRGHSSIANAKKVLGGDRDRLSLKDQSAIENASARVQGKI